jgi:hypothetical protein
MSDKETVLQLIHSLPAEVSLSEILQGIETVVVSREDQQYAQIMALRTSAEAASILTQALAEYQSRKNGSED